MRKETEDRDPPGVPARSRSHHPHQGVPAPQAQDAGVLFADRRSLPHAADAHARSRADRAHDREGAAPARGADRSDRARPRSGPHAVRPRRRARAERAWCPAASITTNRACASSTCSRTIAQGLNLTWEVRDGIARHSKGKHGMPVGAPPEHRASTIEGQVARVADIVAYVNHDIDDAVRAGILSRIEPAEGRGRHCSATRRPSASAGWSPTSCIRRSPAA